MNWCNNFHFQNNYLQSYLTFFDFSVDVVWYDVLLLHGEHVQGEPIYVQQLPENDGSLQPRRFLP